jgi:uncharacterized protein DUF6056
MSPAAELLASPRFARAVVVGGSLAVIVPALALIGFAQPVADDFGRATIDDVPRYVLDEAYLRWSGRWAGVGLEALLFSRLPLLSVYPFLLWALHALHFVALLAAWRALVGRAGSWPTSLGLALGSFAFLLAGYPGLGQSVFWATGAIEYQLPVSLALVLIAALLAAGRSNGSPGRNLAAALGLGVLGFLVTGTHEVVALMVMGVLVVGVALAVIEGRPRLHLWLIVLVFVTFGTAVNLLAPGNAVRAATDFPHGRSLGTAIFSLIQLLIQIARWCLDVKLLAGSALLALMLTAEPRAMPEGGGGRRLRAWVIPLGGGAVLLGACAAVAVATGSMGPARLRNLLFMALATAWVVSLHAIVTAAPRLAHRWAHPALRLGRGVAALLFAASLLVSMNNVNVVQDLLLRAPAWRAAIAERYAIVRAAARRDGGAADVVVRPIARLETFKHDYDVGPDPDYWTNRSFARFFGVRSVRVEGAAP